MNTKIFEVNRLGLGTLLCACLAFSNSALAEDSAALATAIANAQKLPAEPATKNEIEEILNPSLKKNKSGFKLAWAHAVGEGGHEECTSVFNNSGTLVTFDCAYEYVSESKGPENSRMKINVKRWYDEQGTLTKVNGRVTNKRLRDGKQVENRKIMKANDEKLAELSKPLLKLDASLQH
jgi:hypothetical protein